MPNPTALLLPASPAAANYASAPDTVALSFGGDIDVRAWIAMDDWTPTASSQRLLTKYTASGNQRSWFFDVLSAGTFRFMRSPDGSATSIATSSVAPTVADGATLGVRATRASATGTVQFFTSTDPPTSHATATWTQLGTNQTTTTGNFFDSTAAVMVGASDAGTTGTTKLIGKVFYAEVRSGIGGTVVASFDPTQVSVLGIRNPATYTDPQGNVWTVGGTAWNWFPPAAPGFLAFM